MSIESLLNALGGGRHSHDCNDDRDTNEFHVRINLAREIIINATMDFGEKECTAEAIVDGAWEIADVFYTKMKEKWDAGQAERKAKRERFKKASEAHENAMRESLKEPTLPTDDVRSFQHISGKAVKVIFRTHGCWEQDGETGELLREKDFVHVYAIHHGAFAPFFGLDSQHFETIDDALSAIGAAGFTQLAKNIDESVVH